MNCLRDGGETFPVDAECAADEELGPGGVQATRASMPPGRRVTRWEGRMPRRFRRQLHPFTLPPAVAGVPVALCSQQRSGWLAFQC